MIILRYISVILLVHFTGAIIIGFTSMGAAYGLPAGVFYAVLGFPVFLIEVPIVSIGLFSLERASTARTKVVVSAIGLGVSFLPLLVGSDGSKYETGVAIAWPVGAVIVILAHLVIQRGIKKQAWVQE